MRQGGGGRPPCPRPDKPARRGAGWAAVRSQARSGKSARRRASRLAACPGQATQLSLYITRGSALDDGVGWADGRSPPLHVQREHGGVTAVVCTLYFVVPGTVLSIHQAEAAVSGASRWHHCKLTIYDTLYMA